MKRFCIAAVMAASFVSISGAQTFEAGINGGYGIGLADSIGSNFTYNTFGSLTRYEDVYGSKGNGFKAVLDVTCYLNESLGIIAMSGYSGKVFGKMSGGYSTEFQWGTWGGGSTVKTSYMSVSLGIKVRGASIMKSIRPYAYIAPGLYFPKRDDIQSLTGVLAAPDDHVTYTYSTGWGFTAGVGAVYSITDQIGVKLEISPTFAYANITQYTYTHGASLTKETYIFKNDTKDQDFPQNPPSGTFYRHGQPRDRFNSLDIKLGACYDF
jgi:hypothetical protein